MTRHQHEWAPSRGGYACTACTATSRACIECGRPTGNDTPLCHPCHDRVRSVLDGIRRALAYWQPAPTPTIRATRWRRVTVRSANNETIHGRTVPQILYDWRVTWMQNGAGGQPAADSLNYLTDHILWAATHPDHSDWAAWLADMRKCRWVARRDAGLTPERIPWPCPYCGGRTVQDWSDHDWQPLPGGLSDEVRCTSCTRTWPSLARFVIVCSGRITDMPTRDPWTTIHLEDARTIWPDLPIETLRSWTRRGDLQPADRDRHGRPLYRVADLTDLIERRQSTNRRGPKTSA